jgi:lysophospholipase L1-like esterase
MRKKKIISTIRYLLFLGLSCTVILLLLEGGLRLFTDRPYGWFHFRPLDNTSLYLPDTTLHMTMGPIPYTVKTNSLGFRGPEITLEKPAGVTRIAALGDSITDGFYVDNPDTWPVLLEAMLRDAGCRAEVVNAARGDISIDREFEILRRYVTPLDPDYVLLTFVTNDPDTIRDMDREELLTRATFNRQPAAASEALLFARTAIGELLLDLSLRQRYKKYRQFQRGMTEAEKAARYDIPGSRNFEENTRIFMENYAQKSDSILLYDPLPAYWVAVMEKYIYALDAMNRYCRDNGSRLLFSYFPAYNQVHDGDAPMEIRDRLRAGCKRLDIPFLDLTPHFRAGVKKDVLHLAPIDFHPNPAGNRVIARAVADFLVREKLLTCGS